MNQAPVSSKAKLWMIVAIIGILAVGFVWLLYRSKPKASQPTLQQTTSAQVLQVINQYFQAQEDSVGADQASTTSWLQVVQPLTTAAWFTQLQPNLNSSTGSTPIDYYTAHTNGYLVKAVVSDCTNNGAVTTATTTLRQTCALTDTTINRANAPVAATALPFGWVHSGQQPAPTITLVKQSGKWVISNVTIDQQTAE